MKLWTRATALAAIALTAGCAATAALQAPAPTASRIVAEMKAACGGDAWNLVRGWHETGTVDLPGRPGLPYEIWHDMRALKTAMINRVEGHVVRHWGFDGEAHWQVRPDGQIERNLDPALIRRHRRDTYLSSSGWYFPDRFPARIVVAGAETVDGQLHDVLRITPDDADPFDLWVSRQTRRIRRIVAGNEYADLTDYRMFDGLCSATTGRQGDGNPTHEIVLHVGTIETRSAIPPATLQPPAATP